MRKRDPRVRRQDQRHTDSFMAARFHAVALSQSERIDELRRGGVDPQMLMKLPIPTDFSARNCSDATVERVILEVLKLPIEEVRRELARRNAITTEELERMSDFEAKLSLQILLLAESPSDV